MADPWQDQNDYIDFSENRADWIFDSGNRMMIPGGIDPASLEPVRERIDTPVFRMMQNYALSAPNTLEGMLAAEFINGGTVTSAYSKIIALANSDSDEGAMIRELLPKTENNLGEEVIDQKYILNKADNMESSLVQEMSALEGNPDVMGSIEEGGFYTEKPSELEQKYLDAGLPSPRERYGVEQARMHTPMVSSPPSADVIERQRWANQGPQFQNGADSLHELQAMMRAGMGANPFAGQLQRAQGAYDTANAQRAALPQQYIDAALAENRANRSGPGVSDMEWGQSLGQDIGNVGDLDWKGAVGDAAGKIGGWLGGALQATPFGQAAGAVDALVGDELGVLKDMVVELPSGAIDYVTGGGGDGAEVEADGIGAGVKSLSEIEELRKKVRESQKQFDSEENRRKKDLLAMFNASMDGGPISGQRATYWGDMGSILGAQDRGETPLSNVLQRMGGGMVNTGWAPQYDPRITDRQVTMTDRDNNPYFEQNAMDALRRGTGWYKG